MVFWIVLAYGLFMNCSPCIFTICNLLLRSCCYFQHWVTCVLQVRVLFQFIYLFGVQDWPQRLKVLGIFRKLLNIWERSNLLRNVVKEELFVPKWRFSLLCFSVRMTVNQCCWTGSSRRGCGWWESRILYNIISRIPSCIYRSNSQPIKCEILHLFTEWSILLGHS